jgi:hypothetical protein
MLLLRCDFNNNNNNNNNNNDTDYNNNSVIYYVFIYYDLFIATIKYVLFVWCMQIKETA